MGNWLTRFFHRPSTAFPQAEVLLRIDEIGRSQGELEHAFTLLRRSMEDFEERTARKLDRYRKWQQTRKGGKFGNLGPEDVAQSTNDSGSIPSYTHKQIEAAARKQGLLA